MQEQTHKPFIRNYHNHSNIHFNDTENLISSQNKANYRSMSQVGRLMTDKVQQLTPSRMVYHYNNKIAQVERDYNLPLANDPQFQRNNVKFQQFFQQAGKFIKPYNDLTKYSDSLMKNRQLLRRGQFDLPTYPFPVPSLSQNSKPQTSQSHANTHTTFLKSNKTAFLKPNSQTMQNIRKRKPSSDCKNGFDKTLKQHTSAYHTLVNEEKRSQKDEVKFRNSMNRILAAEMICYKMMAKGEMVKPQTVRLEKRMTS